MPIPCFLGEPDGRAGVLGGCGQVGSQQEERAGKALLDARPEHNVVPRVGARLPVQLGGAPTVSLVLLERAEPVQDLAALGPGRRDHASVAQQLPGPLPLSSLPGMDSRLDRSPVPDVLDLRGRQAPGQFGQFGRRREGAAAMRSLCCVLECAAHGRIRTLGTQGQVPGAFLGIGEELRQAAMERAALAAARRRVHAGRDQWMGEANAIPLELDHVRGERRRQPLLDPATCRTLHELECRVRHGGRREQSGACIGGKHGEAITDERRERPG